MRMLKILIFQVYQKKNCNNSELKLLTLVLKNLSRHICSLKLSLVSTSMTSLRNSKRRQLKSTIRPKVRLKLNLRMSLTMLKTTFKSKSPTLSATSRTRCLKILASSSTILERVEARRRRPPPLLPTPHLLILLLQLLQSQRLLPLNLLNLQLLLKSSVMLTCLPRRETSLTTSRRRLKVKWVSSSSPARPS